MKNVAVSDITTKRYQTRRHQEIKVRDAARKQREANRQSNAAQLAQHAADFDPNEDVVPIAEPENIVRYWRVSQVRREWSKLYKRVGWAKNQLEEFIAARRRPAIQVDAKTCPTIKHPGWYLGHATPTE